MGVVDGEEWSMKIGIKMVNLHERFNLELRHKVKLSLSDHEFFVQSDLKLKKTWLFFKNASKWLKHPRYNRPGMRRNGEVLRLLTSHMAPWPNGTRWYSQRQSSTRQNNAASPEYSDEMTRNKLAQEETSQRQNGTTAKQRGKIYNRPLERHRPALPIKHQHAVKFYSVIGDIR